MNGQILVSECRLIFGGEARGVVPIEEARRIAEEAGLDLVEVSPNANPPVVKVIDYGKFKYDQQKRKNETKKRQSVTQLKEVQFRPNIEAHDLDTKLSRVRRFLHQGDKVKMVMQFRGREMAYKDIGMKKFSSIIDRAVEMGAVSETDQRMVHNHIIVILAPDKKRIKQLEKEEAAAARAKKVAVKEDDEDKESSSV